MRLKLISVLAAYVLYLATLTLSDTTIPFGDDDDSDMKNTVVWTTVPNFRISKSSVIESMKVKLKDPCSSELNVTMFLDGEFDLAKQFCEIRFNRYIDKLAEMCPKVNISDPGELINIIYENMMGSTRSRKRRDTSDAAVQTGKASGKATGKYRRLMKVMKVFKKAPKPILFMGAAVGTPLGLYFWATSSIDTRFNTLEHSVNDGHRRAELAVNNTAKAVENIEALRNKTDSNGILLGDFVRVRMYQYYFNEMIAKFLVSQNILSVAVNDWRDGKINIPFMSFFGLLNFTNGLDINWGLGTPLACSMSKDQSDFTITFKAPIIEPHLRLLKSTPFSLMKQEGDLTCTYQADVPEYIAVGDEDCFYIINPSRLVGVGQVLQLTDEECITRQQFIDSCPINLVKCVPSQENDNLSFQKRIIGDENVYIYCPKGTYTMNDITENCPDYPKEIPSDIGFSMNGVQYDPFVIERTSKHEGHSMGSFAHIATELIKPKFPLTIDNNTWHVVKMHEGMGPTPYINKIGWKEAGFYMIVGALILALLLGLFFYSQYRAERDRTSNAYEAPRVSRGN